MPRPASIRALFSVALVAACAAALAEEPKKPLVSGDRPRAGGFGRAGRPKIDKPISFDTPEADAILAALEVFPPDTPWTLVVPDWPLHPKSKDLVASIGKDKP